MGWDRVEWYWHMGMSYFQAFFCSTFFTCILQLDQDHYEQQCLPSSAILYFLHHEIIQLRKELCFPCITYVQVFYKQSITCILQIKRPLLFFSFGRPSTSITHTVYMRHRIMLYQAIPCSKRPCKTTAFVERHLCSQNLRQRRGIVCFPHLLLSSMVQNCSLQSAHHPTHCNPSILPDSPNTYFVSVLPETDIKVRCRH